MTLDIRGSLKNTKISSDGYVVIEELISNSIDAFLIRQHAEAIGSPWAVCADLRSSCVEIDPSP